MHNVNRRMVDYNIHDDGLSVRTCKNSAEPAEDHQEDSKSESLLQTHDEVVDDYGKQEIRQPDCKAWTSEHPYQQHDRNQAR